jgi:hypothetical protein
MSWDAHFEVLVNLNTVHRLEALITKASRWFYVHKS